MLAEQQRKFLLELQGLDSEADMSMINGALEKAQEYQELNKN
jgi:hypothetical protein